MSRLDDFLNMPDVDEITKVVNVGGRIGNITIKAMTNGQFSRMRKRCSTEDKKTKVPKLDAEKFNITLIANQVTEPDFNDADFLEKVGCATGEEFLARKFTPGEITDMATAVMEVSGFLTSDEDEDPVESAKN